MDNIESFIGKTIMTTLPFYGRIKVYVLNVNPYTRMAQIVIQTPQGYQMIEVPYSDFNGFDLVTNNVILPFNLPFKWYGPGYNKPWFGSGSSGNFPGPMKPPGPPQGSSGNPPGPMKPPGPPQGSSGNPPGPMKPPGPPQGSSGNPPGPMKPPGPQEQENQGKPSIFKPKQGPGNR